MRSRDALTEAIAAAELAAARTAPTIVVSNEVGMGVHPATRAGCDYRDLLGRVNSAWSERAQAAYLLVAGRAVPLHRLEALS
jgi:adenosyl cobinamide kinase/adenosyl cobinamide phosphate guanylyltransferase